MVLTIEDGTGVAGADSYNSEAEVQAYILATYGAAAETAWIALGAATQELRTREGSQYVDLTFHSRWPGTRANETQGMDHPRYDLVDSDGWTIASTVVHQAVKDAAAEASYRASLGTVLIPDEASPGELGAESIKVGPIAISSKYEGGGQGSQPYFPKIERILAPITTPPGEFERA